MAVIRVRDLAYGRLRSPDLDAQEEFLTAFGMVRAARTPTALYMRGTDPVHHIHVTEKGDPRFIGFAWAVTNEDDLKAIAKYPGASGIENIDEPGGGKRVRVTEPNGYTIEIVYGMQTVQPIQVVRQPLNTGVEPLKRAGEVMRIASGPSSVKRIGHAGTRFAKEPGNRSLVSRNARPGPFGRRLCGREAEHHRTVQPDRCRR